MPARTLERGGVAGVVHPDKAGTQEINGSRSIANGDSSSGGIAPATVSRNNAAIDAHTHNLRSNPALARTK